MSSVVVLLRNIQMVSAQDGTTTQFPNGTEETPAAITLSTCGYLPAWLIKKIGLEKPFYSYLLFFLAVFLFLLQRKVTQAITDTQLKTVILKTWRWLFFLFVFFFAFTCATVSFIRNVRNFGIWLYFFWLCHLHRSKHGPSTIWTVCWIAIVTFDSHVCEAFYFC